jgi:hypothetical protein
MAFGKNVYEQSSSSTKKKGSKGKSSSSSATASSSSVTPFLTEAGNLTTQTAPPVGTSLLDGNVSFNPPIQEGLDEKRWSNADQKIRLFEEPGEMAREALSIPFGFAAESDAAKKLARGEFPTGWEAAKAAGLLGLDAASMVVSPIRALGVGTKLLSKGKAIAPVLNQVANPYMGQAAKRVGVGALIDAGDNVVIEGTQQALAGDFDASQLGLAGGVGGVFGLGLRGLPFLSPTNKTMQGTMSQDRDRSLRAIGNVERLIPKTEPLTGKALEEAQKKFPWVKYQGELDAFNYSADNPAKVLSELEGKAVLDAEAGRKKLDESVAKIAQTFGESDKGLFSTVLLSNHPELKNYKPSDQKQILKDANKLFLDYASQYGGKKGPQGTVQFEGNVAGGPGKDMSYPEMLRDIQKRINANRVEKLSAQDPEFNKKSAVYKIASDKITAVLESLDRSAGFKKNIQGAADAYGRKDFWEQVGQATRGSDPAMQLRPYAEALPTVIRSANPLRNPVAAGQAAAGLETAYDLGEDVYNDIGTITTMVREAWGAGGVREFQELITKDGMTPYEAFQLMGSGVYKPKDRSKKEK